MSDAGVGRLGDVARLKDGDGGPKDFGERQGSPLELDGTVTFNISLPVGCMEVPAGQFSAPTSTEASSGAVSWTLSGPDLSNMDMLVVQAA